jgi:hypothetical protein
MYEGRELRIEQQLEFLRILEEENAAISGDILEIGLGLWGIHGFIAVDGDVLMAEFFSYEDARSVLDQLGYSTRSPLQGSPVDLAPRPLR